MTNHPNRSQINWMETYPASMPKGVEFVAISDGETTFCGLTSRRSLDRMIADYARGYGFNEPGDVDATASLYAADWDGGQGGYTTAKRFTIRSTNGKSGKLVR